MSNAETPLPPLDPDGPTAEPSPPAKVVKDTGGAPDYGRAWRLVLRVTREHPLAITGIVVASTIGGLLEAAMLLLLVRAATALSAGEDSVTISVGVTELEDVTVTRMLMAVLLIAAVRFVFQMTNVLINTRVFQRRLIRLRTRLIEAYLRSSWEVQSAEREGHFNDLAWTQSSRVSQMAEHVSLTITAFVNVVTLLASTLIVDPVAAVVTAVVLGSFGVALRPLMTRSRQSSLSAQTVGREYASWVHDLVRLSKDITVFGVIDPVAKRNRKVVVPTARHVAVTRFYAQLVPNAYQTGAVVVLALAILAILQLDLGGFGQLGAIILLLYRSLNYGQALQGMIQNVSDSLPSIELLDREIRRFEDNPAVEGGRPVDHVERIELRDVGLVYSDGRAGVQGIDLVVEKGECIGIVGPSGAGKSTLIQILLRLREPTEGVLLVNGEPASEQSLHDWRRHVSWLPQDPELVPGTVVENVAFFREHDAAEVVAALDSAHVSGDVAAWEDGIEQQIGGRGNAVSGGQRQRVALARALVGGPDVLVLDEPTSALDARSEQEVTRTLEELRGQVTMFIVSHRMSTLRMCDRIMVLRDGHVELLDTPARLERQEGFLRDALEIAGQVPADLDATPGEDVPPPRT